ncbi:Glycosyl hydrolases family 39 [Verrucomicrobiia bacterium DG1235]|nr:Glycosyl hydrolases family 39 [Verrucomicrobiae bacterium DG1235]
MISRLLLAALLSATCLSNANDKTEVHVDGALPTGELRPIWNYFGADEAGTVLTPEGQHLLHELNQLSDSEPIRLRFHHLLTSGDGTLALKWSSTNVYTEDENGDPTYDWTLMDQIMDQLTQPGIEPFVQAAFMPQDLSSQPEPYTPKLTQHGLPKDMVSGGAFYPPKDYQKWQDLIAAWVQHSVDRYGKEAVSSWLWELWNEPESPYFRGTVAEYCKMYDHFTYAVKSIVPDARVGGPHVTDPGWKNGDVFLSAFLEHCRSGTHAVTGEIGSPLDFVAYHAKGTTRIDENGHVEMHLRNQLRTIQTYSEIIASYPEFAHLPVYLGESDPEGCAGCPATLDPERDYRRTSQFASYTAASFLRKQDLVSRYGGNLQGAVSWAFTFHDQPWFNGLRALTTNEVTLPVLNAFKLFSRLGPTRLQATSTGMLETDTIISDSVRADPDIGVLATRSQDGAVQILLWNYHDVANDFSTETPVSLSLSKIFEPGQAATATLTRIDEHHANAYTLWRAMDEPQSPSVEQISALHAAAELVSQPFPLAPATDGSLQAELILPRQSIAFIELRKSNP